MILTRDKRLIVPRSARFIAPTFLRMAASYSPSGGTTYTTWNPLDKDSAITLSNGDLTATCTGGSHPRVRAVDGKTSGKYYWEFTPTDNASGNNVVGVANTSSPIVGYLGYDANSWGWLGAGLSRNNGSNGPTVSTWTNGDVLGIAVDLGAGKIWFAKNGTWQNSGDPAAGTGAIWSNLSGTIKPACSIYDSNADITANFGASAFTYSAPSGFAAGWPT